MPPLQPKDNTLYATKAFWEERYAGADTEAEDMDWTLKYDKLKEPFDRLVVPVVGPREREGGIRTLILGCGNSTLSPDLASDSYAVTSLDFSANLITKMQVKYADRPEMAWVEGDVMALPFDGASFDLVVDKATMDSFMTAVRDPWNPEPDVVAQVKAEVDEAFRVLRPGGIFAYITFGQPHFRKPLLARPGWTLEHYELGDGSDSFPYFLYTMTKASA